MKKSKIIIPALGMLLLSTAASVSGTVAWFTTVSSADARITSFAVRKLGGDLDYSVAAGTGTVKSEPSNAKSAITLNGTNPALCDASYDHLAGVCYHANSNASAFPALASESAWSVSGNNMITYYAVSWTYTFTYQFGGDTTAVNLYLDAAGSTVSATKTDDSAIGNSGNQTYKGFRIAFVNQQATDSAVDYGRSVVWAKNQSAANCKFIDADTTISSGVYSNNGVYSNADADDAMGDLLSSSNLAALGENGSGSTARADFLGQFTSTSTTITIKCVAWYEGTDPNVVNGAEMDKVSCVLNFYTRPNAA